MRFSVNLHEEHTHTLLIKLISNLVFVESSPLMPDDLMTYFDSTSFDQ